MYGTVAGNGGKRGAEYVRQAQQRHIVVELQLVDVVRLTQLDAAEETAEKIGSSSAGQATITLQHSATSGR